MLNLFNSLRNKILTAIQKASNRKNLLAKLSLMLTTDWPEEDVDVALVFGRTKGDANDSFFEVIASLYKSGKVKYILINGSDGRKQGGNIPGESWPGGEVFKRRLIEKGVPEEVIHMFKHESGDPKKDAHHTAAEAEMMKAYCEKMHWAKGVIIAQPHQLLRCMCCMLFQTQEMKLYCATPRSVKWFEKTAGSQGEGEDMERNEHIGTEYAKVQSYRFNLATLEQLEEYLRKR